MEKKKAENEGRVEMLVIITGNRKVLISSQDKEKCGVYASSLLPLTFFPSPNNSQFWYMYICQ